MLRKCEWFKLYFFIIKKIKIYDDLKIIINYKIKKLEERNFCVLKLIWFLFLILME